MECPECGFVYDLATATSAGPTIVAAACELAVLLEGARSATARPEPDTWSPLEYACHVRDVLLVQRERVLGARWMDTPVYPPMGRDERSGFDGYDTQAPADVARQLADAARLFANVLSRLDDTAWERTLLYNFPTPMNRSLRWVAVHTVHEATHHLLDVRDQLTT
jgi:hypothetical protein